MTYQNKLLFAGALLFYATSVANAQYSVLVIGIPETEAVEARVQFYAAHFQLDTSYHITVSFLEKLPHRKQGMVTLEGDRHIHIRVNKSMRLQDMEKALAHEMVHVKQFIRGELRQEKNGDVMWQGFLHKNIKNIPYRQRRWEKEAFKYEDRLVESFQKHGSSGTFPETKGQEP